VAFGRSGERSRMSMSLRSSADAQRADVRAVSPWPR